MITPPRPKSKNKNKRNYFTQETEDAIILYNRMVDPILKSKIYEEQIYYAFFKLTENIIHTFKFYHTEVDKITDLQQELFEFLLTKIHLYHHSKSIEDRLCKIIIDEFKEKYENESFLKFTNNADQITQKQINDFISKLNVSKECLEKLSRLTPPKAYSYFGTAVKRWLIIYTDKNYKSKVKKIQIDNIEQNEQFNIDPTHPAQDSYYKDNLSEFIDRYVEYCTNNIFELFPKDEEAKIADAILELFRKRDNIIIFNKKALYIHIREKINIKTPKITKVAEELYKIFKTSYTNYLDKGYIKFD